jgi:hypothetical protein
MIINGHLISVSGKRVTIELDQPIDLELLVKLTGDLHPSVAVEIADNRTITPEQRKKAWAMINDIANWQGDLPKAVEETFKYFAMSTYSEITEHFSLADCSVTTARLYIELLLAFCFKWDVPFATKTWDAISGDYGTQKRCLEHRECVICRKHAQYAHVETVGMGMDRKKIDHSQHRFMSLCAVHHTEQHTIGINTFIQRYHIKPIKLTYDELVKLGIMRKGTAYYFKEQLAAEEKHVSSN